MSSRKVAPAGAAKPRKRGYLLSNKKWKKWQNS